MIPDLLRLENLGDKFGKLACLGDKRLADSKLSAISLLRLTEGAKAHLGYTIPALKLYVTADEPAAKSILRKLNSFSPDAAVYLPHRDDVLLDRGAASKGVLRDRLSSLSSFISGKVDSLVITADALLQLLPKPDLFDSLAVEIAVEDILSPFDAADKLARAGYERREGISEIGDFSLRGDVLDVLSVDGKAYRVSFFDELVEEIKIIDLAELVSLGTVDKINVPPCGDTVIAGDDYESVVKILEKNISIPSAFRLAPMLRQGVNPPSAIWAIPFTKQSATSVFDVLEYVADKTGKRGVVIFDEPKVIREKLNLLRKEFEGRLRSLGEEGEILPAHKDAMLDELELRRRIMLARKVSFSSLSLSNPLFDPQTLIEPKCLPVTKYYLDAGSIFGELREFRKYGHRVIVACGSEERAKGVVSSLLDGDVFAEYSADGNGTGEDGEGVIVTPLQIESGFCYPDLKVVVVGVSESIGKRRDSALFIPKPQFNIPKQGDYVVHRIHGVGLCEGTTIIKAGDFDREFIVLRYRDGDVLYVAADQTDNLQKFIGEENPRLNKLGGREFEREKSKVRSSVRKLAVNLLELYAKREKQRGYKYSEDTVWQKEFEDAFEYDETVDQLKTIDEIKHDMEEGKIMDRVVVGDVGFGKTEVAFRAMFKTVLDAKQAVLLAPTTILARQHYETLKPRLKAFGIDCALMTRLQSGAENRRNAERIADGTLHMLIGTHKILGDKLKFHDLGLLVLDEEQRFGVEHKEKLKEKYPLVNVLTLSATPIPRTLNMALSGIRDISMLETAPKGRLPVQTYVSPYSDSLVKDAISRECARGGQTLILLNNIEALDVYANKLGAMMGEDARVISAHGQMSASELEKRIGDFYEKKYDVLLSTTIIENGIDLPDANTLIVINSDHFGLSQLYQLRGRVGRRGALAHAYFTVPENGTLTNIAEKRLQALLDNTEIGSGFKVALSDLSIRGAGNMLGAEQHGHIERVGYEMYIDLLNEAVEELRTGIPHRDTKDPEMKIDAAAYIKEGYVGARDKIRIYRRIATVASFSARDELISELNDVFGTADRPLLNLIDISLLKNLSKGFDVSKITVNRAGASVTFGDSAVFSNEGLMRAVSVFAGEAVLTSTIPPSLVFQSKTLSPEEKIAKLLAFFAAALD